MEGTDTIDGLAGQLGRLSAQFEPGTPFYEQVVHQVVLPLEKARDRDALEQAMSQLETLLTPHLMDEDMQRFHNILQQLRGSDQPLPVDGFRSGFLMGFGWELPADAHAAGRSFKTNGPEK